MITFEQAKQIAIDKIGPECALIEESTLEKPYGWYFSFQSRKFLQSDEFSDMLIGSGGFIVEKENGRIFEFGSAYSLERNLRAYEKGFKYQAYDLIVLSVSDMDQTVRLLRKLDMGHVVPEVEYGVEWRIPRRYHEAQIKAKLMSLPCTFENQGFYFRVEVFEEIDAAQCCWYELREHCAESGVPT